MRLDLRLDRVVVRTSRLADLDVLCEADADSLPTEASESTDRRDRLRSRIETGSDLATDGVCFFTVDCDGRPVGDIQARAPRYGFPPGVCEIGISLVRTARGNGVGRVAVRLFSDFLLAERWSRVQGATAVDNIAMCRAFEASDFLREGVASAYLPDGRGGRIDCAVYARVQKGAQVDGRC